MMKTSGQHIETVRARAADGRLGDAECLANFCPRDCGACRSRRPFHGIRLTLYSIYMDAQMLFAAASIPGTSPLVTGALTYTLPFCGYGSHVHPIVRAETARR
jgi:hypothetical protein